MTLVFAVAIEGRIMCCAYGFRLKRLPRRRYAPLPPRNDSFDDVLSRITGPASVGLAMATLAGALIIESKDATTARRVK